MSDALLALHFQNDICHRDGLIPFSLDRGTSAAANFLSASKRALDEARRAGWTIAHIHIAFAPDYSDLLRNCRLFLKTETLGALKRGAWGAAAFAGFEPAEDEIVVTTNCNSGFRRTDLEAVAGRTRRQPRECHGARHAIFRRAYRAGCSRYRLSCAAIGRLLRLGRHGGASRFALHADDAGGRDGKP